MVGSIAYWVALSTGGWHQPLAGHNRKVWMTAIACNITEAQSHKECVGGRSVTEIHWSVTGLQNKSVNGVERNEWTQKCNGSMLSRFT